MKHERIPRRRPGQAMMDQFRKWERTREAPPDSTPTLPAEWQEPAQIEMAEPGRTLLIQGRAHIPIFRGAGGVDFLCAGCGNLLIKEYSARQFPALTVLCGQCQCVTFTSDWPDDEPIPQNFVAVPPGTAKLDGQVNARRAGTTTQHELWRISKLQAPDLTRLPVFGNPNSAGELIAIMNSFTGGEFGASLERARAAQARGEIRSRFPLEWAILAEERMAAAYAVNMDSDDLSALTIAYACANAVLAWRHHPMARAIVRALFGSEFHHTLALLSGANHLHRVGNRVGFLDASSNGTGQKAPDLYINVWPHPPDHRIAIEVKAPAKFQWPQITHDRDEILHTVKRRVYEASKQIKAQGDGLVLFGALAESAVFGDLLDGVLEELARRNQYSRSVIGVAASVLVLRPPLERHANGWMRSGLISRWMVHKNPRYAGIHRLNE